MYMCTEVLSWSTLGPDLGEMFYELCGMSLRSILIVLCCKIMAQQMDMYTVAMVFLRSCHGNGGIF